MMKSILAAVLLSFLSSCSHSPKKGQDKAQISATPILVIAHRGASGLRPEHTLAAYELGIDQGADFIEPDLVITKDGVLIARHENELSDTTDVAAKFPRRKTTKLIEGQKVTGWFAEDLTLKEIKTLRAKQRVLSRDQSWNGQFEIPTFAEVIDLAKRKSLQTGRRIGIYPEVKHPTYFDQIKKPLVPPLVFELRRAGWTKKEDPVYVQSFELTALRQVREQLDVKLVYLIGDPQQRPADRLTGLDRRTYAEDLQESSLKELATWLSGLGPHKSLLFVPGETGPTEVLTPLLPLAKSLGLEVHPYTFRSDAPFLPAFFSGQAAREYEMYFRAGVHGVFSDHPEDAVKARAAF